MTALFCPRCEYVPKGAGDLVQHLMDAHAYTATGAQDRAGDVARECAEIDAGRARCGPGMKGASMAPACANCGEGGHGYDGCPVPKSPRCSGCKRVPSRTGHAPTCPRTRTGEPAGKPGAVRVVKKQPAPKPKARPEQTRLQSGPTLKGALAQVQERLAVLRPEVVELETVERFLLRVQG